MQNIIIKVLNYIYYWNTIEFINGAGSCATVPISRLFPVYYRGMSGNGLMTICHSYLTVCLLVQQQLTTFSRVVLAGFSTITSY